MVSDQNNSQGFDVVINLYVLCPEPIRDSISEFHHLLKVCIGFTRGNLQTSGIYGAMVSTFHPPSLTGIVVSVSEIDHENFC